MKSASTLREFSDQERELLTGYIMAYFWDVSRSFRIVEQKTASNVTLHYAIPATENALGTKQLDSLGSYALALRDDFKANLDRLKIRVAEAAIAVQFLDGKAIIGIVNKNDPRVRSDNPQEESLLSVYLPDSEAAAASEDIGE
jgi:hypothetical protein